jgi:CBS domain-containing protein
MVVRAIPSLPCDWFLKKSLSSSSTSCNRRIIVNLMYRFIPVNEGGHMQLKEIMTTDFHAIPHNATIQEAAKMMRKYDVGLLPVMENGRMIGTVTDRDIIVRAVSEGGDPGRIPVSKAMTASLVYTFEDAELSEAAHLMEDRHVRRLIVANRSRQPVGVVSLGDLARCAGNDSLAGEVLREVSKPASP